MNKKHKIMYISISILIIVVIGITIAYASLRTNLNIKFGKVTGKPITWDIGFQEGTIEGEAFGTSATGRECGQLTVTKDTITVNSIALSKPDDRCSYKLSVENYGGVVARLESITPKTPSNAACDFSKESKMICNNITYQLANDINGNNPVSINHEVGINQIKTMYLVISYTGNSINSENSTQSKAGFTLNYVHK